MRAKNENSHNPKPQRLGKSRSQQSKHGSKDGASPAGSTSSESKASSPKSNVFSPEPELIEQPRSEFRDVFEYWFQHNLESIRSQEWTTRDFELQSSFARDLFPDVEVPGSLLYMEIEGYLERNFAEIDQRVGWAALAITIKCAAHLQIGPVTGDHRKYKEPLP